MFANCPSWIDTNLLAYTRVEEVPDDVFENINALLDKQDAGQPFVSVVIPAHNEELNVLRTIATLANNRSEFSFEIIVVNNKSTDKTQWVLDRLHTRSVFQAKPGCGPARQLGQEVALGKYILMADADCFYPVEWIQYMVHELKQDGVSCVYGRYSFLSNSIGRRLSFFLYESIRDILVEFRHFKRPYLNSLGMSMGYKRNLGIQIGFIDSDIRGEDGRMCFDLMQFGKVVQVRNRSIRVWTLSRTLDKEDGLLTSFLIRVIEQMPKLASYFFSKSKHNTKTSKNSRSIIKK